MFRLVPVWRITPKDGVAEKFDVNQNKKWNIFFGLLEFSNIYTLAMIIINLFKKHSEQLAYRRTCAGISGPWIRGFRTPA